MAAGTTASRGFLLLDLHLAPCSVLSNQLNASLVLVMSSAQVVSCTSLSLCLFNTYIPSFPLSLCECMVSPETHKVEETCTCTRVITFKNLLLLCCALPKVCWWVVMCIYSSMSDNRKTILLVYKLWSVRPKWSGSKLASEYSWTNLRHRVTVPICLRSVCFLPFLGRFLNILLEQKCQWRYDQIEQHKYSALYLSIHTRYLERWHIQCHLILEHYFWYSWCLFLQGQNCIDCGIAHWIAVADSSTITLWFRNRIQDT